MQHQLVIIGAGGHAKVIIDIFRQSSNNWQLLGCLDVAVPIGTMVTGLPVLGGDQILESLRRDGARHAFVAIGDNYVRCRLTEQLQRRGFRIPNAISPQAHIASSARLGAGVAVMAGAVIGPEVTLEDGAIVNHRASVDHESTIQAFAHIAPGATLAGNVHVEPFAMVGCGTSVIQELRIGRGTVVGAGAAVVRDLPDYVVAHGVPARVQRRIERRSAA